MLSPRNSSRSLNATRAPCSMAKDLCVSASSKRAVFLNLTPKIFSNLALPDGLRGILLHDQDRIMTAEAQRIRKRDPDVHRSRLIRDIVQIAFGIRGFVIDGRMSQLVPD